MLRPSSAGIVFMAIRRPLATLRAHLLLLIGVAALGCASSPWASKSALHKPVPSVAAHSEVATATPSATAPAANAQPMQEAMAELERLGMLDPAARDQLTADLKSTDPALWPGLLHQARAVAAYRQRTLHQPGGHGQSSHDAPPGFHESAHVDGLPNSHQAMAYSPVSVHQASELSEAYQAGHFLSEIPQEAQPPSVVLEADERHPGSEVGSNDPSGQHDVQAASHVAEMAGNGNPTAGTPWIEHLQSAIHSLEASAKNNPAEAIRLRMLYLAANRHEEAIRAPESLPAAEQEFWTAQFHGLTTLLDEARQPDAFSRTAEATHVLSDATSKLSELAPLVVRNLAFCTRVHSFGCFEAFSSYRFIPEQRVLLYAEVENFTSRSTPRGYHTSLKSSYQIFDSSGQRVADEDLASTEEFCANRRRDFFIVYDFHLPKRIFPGKHTLRLTIEDAQGSKIGDSSIDFEIISESAARSR